MGGMFKKGSNKTTTESSSSNSNWIADNKDYQGLVNDAINQGVNMDIPGLTNAGYGQSWYDALNNLSKGADYDYLSQAGGYLQGLGQGQLSGGLGLQQQAQDKLSSLANMTQEDYQKGFQSEYNGDLVNQQIAGLTEDVNSAYNQQVNGLNQQASASGNMGSSRAGVAQGVMAGQAQKAISSGSVAYRTTEENNAFNRYSTMLGNQQSSANMLAGLAQNQISQGSNFFNQGMGYQNQATAGWISNQQNAVNAGSMLQGAAQTQADIDRMNAIMSQSPALNNLGYMNQFLGGIAGWKTSGKNSSTTTTPNQSNGMMGGIMGAVGTGVGAYFGGPWGAQLGGSLGGAIGQQM